MLTPGLAQLDNPVSDAKKIVAELKANGYQVLEAYDVTRERFLDTLERFSRDYASGAARGVRVLCRAWHDG